MERGLDPEVKKFLKKIITSLSLGLLWLMAGVTGGIYFELAYKGGAGSIVFFLVMATTLFLLVRFLYRMWKNELRS